MECSMQMIYMQLEPAYVGGCKSSFSQRMLYRPFFSYCMSNKGCHNIMMELLHAKYSSFFFFPFIIIIFCRRNVKERRVGLESVV